MTDITQITSLLNWKLLKGSHNWPGAEGGSCINEVAIVVAGFPYQAVAKPADLPRTFSKELGTLLLYLNDALGDAHRQKLKRFVLRLPGSKDSGSVEMERCQRLRDSVRPLLPLLIQDSLAGSLRSGAERLAFVARLGELIGRGVKMAHRDDADAMLDATLAIIDAAFDIGCQAEPVEAGVVEARLASVKELAIV
jgi:hypothetical protein